MSSSPPLSIKHTVSGTAATPASFRVPLIPGKTFCQPTFARIRAKSALPPSTITSAFIDIAYANPAQVAAVPLPSVLGITDVYNDPAPPGLGSRYIALYSGRSVYPLMSGGMFWVKDSIYEWNGATWIRTIPTAGHTTFVADRNMTYVYGESSPPEWVGRVDMLHYSVSTNFQGNVAEINLLKIPQIPPVGNSSLRYIITVHAHADFIAQFDLKYT